MEIFGLNNIIFRSLMLRHLISKKLFIHVIFDRETSFTKYLFSFHENIVYSRYQLKYCRVC